MMVPGLATAFYNGSPSFLSSWHLLSASCQLGLCIPSDDDPEPHLHRPSLLSDSPTGLFLSRGVPCMVGAPGDPLTPCFIRPINVLLLLQWDWSCIYSWLIFVPFDLSEQPLQFRFLPGQDEIPNMFSTPAQVSRCISLKNSSPCEQMVLVWAMPDSWRSQTHHG